MKRSFLEVSHFKTGCTYAETLLVLNSEILRLCYGSLRALKLAVGTSVPPLSK